MEKKLNEFKPGERGVVKRIEGRGTSAAVSSIWALPRVRTSCCAKSRRWETP